MYLWTKIAVLLNGKERLLYLPWFRFRDQFNSIALCYSHKEVRKSVPAANLPNFVLSTKCLCRGVTVSRQLGFYLHKTGAAFSFGKDRQAHT